MIQNGTKRIWKNVINQTAIYTANFVSSNVRLSSNNDRHTVTKTFTSLHYTSLNYTPLHYTCRHLTSSHLNFTQLHFTARHYTCRHFTFSHLNFTQLYFTPLHYTCRHFTSSHLNFTQPHSTINVHSKKYIAIRNKNNKGTWTEQYCEMLGYLSDTVEISFFRNIALDNGVTAARSFDTPQCRVEHLLKNSLDVGRHMP